MNASSKEENNKSEIMKKIGTTKVTVDVPTDQYKLLIKLKERTGKSIKAIVSEGVELAILEYKELLERKNILMELDEIEDTLASLKRSKK